jgi:hypothetical protein
MHADVRLMRHDGVPIPQSELRAAKARRGDLLVTRRRDPWRSAWIPIAVLMDERSESVLPALDQVRVMRWRGADLVLVGVEHIGRAKASRPQLQAWWVTLIAHPARQGMSPVGKDAVIDLPRQCDL